MTYKNSQSATKAFQISTSPNTGRQTHNSLTLEMWRELVAEVSEIYTALSHTTEN